VIAAKVKVSMSASGRGNRRKVSLRLCNDYPQILFGRRGAICDVAPQETINFGRIIRKTPEIDHACKVVTLD
jgi:hypothetical protein